MAPPTVKADRGKSSKVKEIKGRCELIRNGLRHTYRVVLRCRYASNLDPLFKKAIPLLLLQCDTPPGKDPILTHCDVAPETHGKSRYDAP
jgi:hypothetical protein